MVPESKTVEYFTIGYMYTRNILDIKCTLVGLFDPIVIFFISCLATSESSATLGQSISETEVTLKTQKIAITQAKFILEYILRSD